MMRNPASSMQKTYDDCYLVVSTAVFHEGQGNEPEALRYWRSALDQIYYHNAYKVPANWRPKTQTEKTLQESLRDLEMQCKERVDLLDALRVSRIEAEAHGGGAPNGGAGVSSSAAGGGAAGTTQGSNDNEPGWLGQGTIPVIKYPDHLSRPGAPALPQRPAVLSKKSSGAEVPRSLHQSPPSGSSPQLPPPLPPPTLPVPKKHPSRSPSPEKKGLRTTLRNTRDVTRMSRSPRASNNRRDRPAVAAKAATQAWATPARYERDRLGRSVEDAGSSTTLNSVYGDSGLGSTPDRVESRSRLSAEYARSTGDSLIDTSIPPETSPRRPTTGQGLRPSSFPQSQGGLMPERPSTERSTTATKTRVKSPANSNVASYDSSNNQADSSSAGEPVVPGLRRSLESRNGNEERPSRPTRKPSPRLGSEKIAPVPPLSRPLANSSTPRKQRPLGPLGKGPRASNSEDESHSSDRDAAEKQRRRPRKQREQPFAAEPITTDSSGTAESPTLTPEEAAWKERTESLMKNLPKGVDEGAAKQIFNEIVVQGDEVHWDDVAGLDVAKNALKEAVVYPFLRPDLFMGLREPARGMLLFGPPGTGKTMLARAVATESKSTFFSISASSLTSKYLGESEKLVRALFALARALAPSIIFVDEIDSLLSARSGSGEHEATRRIKTEFLIQWSDLQRAAAGRDLTADKEKGDPTRVLVLAATNLPWAIDEAARRRFVRRQYIPLPEGPVRASQLRTLISHQKHSLNDADYARLVDLTDSFSGSDITALAKDAAMGPLRSLGEALLHMSTDQIRPIGMQDFEKSLTSIRPSVSSKGLQEFEEWARDFGERGG